MDQSAADSSWRANLPRQLAALCGKQWLRYLLLAAIGLLVHLPALQGLLLVALVWLQRNRFGGAGEGAGGDRRRPSFP